jgi:hypothetical protein
MRIRAAEGGHLLTFFRAVLLIAIVAYVILRLRRIARQASPDERDIVVHEIVTSCLGLGFVICAYVWMIGIDARWLPQKLGEWRLLTLRFAMFAALSGVVLGWRRSSRRRR